MPRSSLLLCILVALTSFACVESRAMFHDAILAKVYAKVLVKDKEGNCKKEAMKHKVNQIATNCAGASIAVGVGLVAVDTPDMVPLLAVWRRPLRLSKRKLIRTLTNDALASKKPLPALQR
ncbi:hypothetical protein AeMF1_020291 [Aphanomyces euteiches]|nr:hypothetical protein AeMF1_020291 [Aphanomyces euteiches]